MISCSLASGPHSARRCGGQAARHQRSPEPAQEPWRRDLLPAGFHGATSATIFPVRSLPYPARPPRSRRKRSLTSTSSSRCSRTSLAVCFRHHKIETGFRQREKVQVVAGGRRPGRDAGVGRARGHAAGHRQVTARHAHEVDGLARDALIDGQTGEQLVRAGAAQPSDHAHTLAAEIRHLADPLGVALGDHQPLLPHRQVQQQHRPPTEPPPHHRDVEIAAVLVEQMQPGHMDLTPRQHLERGATAGLDPVQARAREPLGQVPAQQRQRGITAGAKQVLAAKLRSRARAAPAPAARRPRRGSSLTRVASSPSAGSGNAVPLSPSSRCATQRSSTMATATRFRVPSAAAPSLPRPYPVITHQGRLERPLLLAQREDVLDPAAQDPRQLQRDAGGGDTLAGLDRAERLATDPGPFRQLTLLQASLHAQLPKRVPKLGRPHRPPALPRPPPRVKPGIPLPIHLASLADTNGRPGAQAYKRCVCMTGVFFR